MYFKKVYEEGKLIVNYYLPICDAIMWGKRGVHTCNSIMIMVNRYTEGRVKVMQFECLSCGRFDVFKIYQQLEE